MDLQKPMTEKIRRILRQKQLKKRKIRRKRGSCLVEASLTLPLFILCVIALALVIRIIAICENIGFTTCGEMRKIGLNAYQNLNVVSLCRHSVISAVKEENPALRKFTVQNFDYLYTDSRADITIEDLIAIDTEAVFEVKNPIGIYGRITFCQGLLSRGFTGAERTKAPLQASAFSDGEASRIVVVFPKYGYRFHAKSCRYVKQDYAGEACRLEMEFRDAEGKGFTPCLICKGGSGD